MASGAYMSLICYFLKNLFISKFSYYGWPALLTLGFSGNPALLLMFRMVITVMYLSQINIFFFFFFFYFFYYFHKAYFVDVADTIWRSLSEMCRPEGSSRSAGCTAKIAVYISFGEY